MPQPSKKKDADPRHAVVVVGPVAAQAVLDWFSSLTGRNVLAPLKEPDIVPRGAGKGTGTLPTLTRDEAFQADP